MLNKNLQEINIQNMDTELVAQMFKNYQSNVLFHLEGMYHNDIYHGVHELMSFTSYQRLERRSMNVDVVKTGLKGQLCIIMSSAR